MANHQQTYSGLFSIMSARAFRESEDIVQMRTFCTVRASAQGTCCDPNLLNLPQNALQVQTCGEVSTELEAVPAEKGKEAETLKQPRTTISRAVTRLPGLKALLP